MKHLLLVVISLLIIIGIQAENNSSQNIQMIDSVQLSSIKSDIDLLKSSHDSIIAQNETLNRNLEEHRLREGYFSDVIGGIVNWFSLFVTIIITGIGLFSWNKYRNINKHVEYEITKAKAEIALVVRDLEQNYKDFRRDIYDKVLIIHSLSIDARKAEAEKLMTELRRKFKENLEDIEDNEIKRIVELYISISIERINAEMIQVKELDGDPSNWIGIIIEELKISIGILNISTKYAEFKDLNPNILTTLRDIRNTISILKSDELEAQLSTLIANIVDIKDHNK